MQEDFMKPQGTITPTMFIGLGGIGSRIVDRIAGRAAYLPNWELQLRGLTTFVAVDTNILDLNALKHVPKGSQINIGAFDKRKVVENYRKSNNRQALQWIDKNYEPREGVKPGAGQIRVESRLGFHYSSPEIRGKLQDLVQYTLDPHNNWRQNQPANYYVYLYCSVAGGTGSGSFLAMAYLIQDVLRSQGWQPRVIGNLVLSTLLTRLVGSDLHLNIHGNSYAALKELEHLQKMNYQAVKLERPKGEPFVFWNNEQSDEIPFVRHGPFFHSFLFDRPANSEVANVEETVGDASFLQVFTPIIATVAAEYDNYEQHLQSLTHFPGENKNVGQGYTKNYGAFGTAALVLPANDLLEYSALRFAADALRRQITFGTGRGSADDHERALDQFRINYNDPEFRNLEESARFERINDSFRLCVQTMANLDAKANRKEGYWYRMVEEVDQGFLKGLDKDGKEIRTETLLARIQRLLEEDRKPVIDKVAIKNRSFVFMQDAVNQIHELVSRFKQDIASASIEIETAKERLRGVCAEGRVVTTLDPKPTPMQERYVVIQLLKLLDTKLLPEATDQFEKARAKSFANPAVQERLEKELPASLQEAAQAKKILVMRDDEGFLAVRSSSEAEFLEVIRAQKRYYDADLRLTQFQSLRDYLARRARQYATLSTRMNSLVQDLEAEAESLRTGVAPKVPRLALSVEVFETLQQPRSRMWSEVFDHLFINDGRDLTTFDRQTLAVAISTQLEPVKDPQTGRWVEKPEHKLVADLKRAMIDLGRTRLRGSIFGDQDQRGLTLESGLEMEARIARPPRPGVPMEDSEIRAYMDEKFVAVHLMSTLIARTKTAEMRSLDDGVKLANKRHFALRPGSVSGEFAKRFEEVLERCGRQMSKAEIQDPHIALVHDVELPIPMYYFEAVTGEIEQAYSKVMSNERRAFHLHTDYNWEHSLPDLNPRKTEIGVTWSLEMLLEGLLTKLVANVNAQWVWQRDGDSAVPLGANLAASLYSLVSIHEHQDLGPRFKKAISESKTLLGAEEYRIRSLLFRDWVGKVTENIAIRGRDHSKTREDDLELPILRALLQLVDKRVEAAASDSGSAAADEKANVSQTLTMGF